jgi:hypothetical protein
VVVVVLIYNNISWGTVAAIVVAFFAVFVSLFLIFSIRLVMSIKLKKLQPFNLEIANTQKSMKSLKNQIVTLNSIHNIDN